LNDRKAQNEVNSKGRLKMHKLGITAVLLLFAGMAVAQATGSQTQGAASNAAGQAQGAASSAASQAQGAASSAATGAQNAASQTAGAAQQGAQTGYEKTKQGASNAAGAATGAATGDQSAGQDQTGAASTAGQTGGTAGTTTTGANKGLPQSASPLPLLGLLGLGSLGFGVWKLRYFR
jgi:hypothetical protein